MPLGHYSNMYLDFSHRNYHTEMLTTKKKKIEKNLHTFGAQKIESVRTNEYRNANYKSMPPYKYL